MHTVMIDMVLNVTSSYMKSDDCYMSLRQQCIKPNSKSNAENDEVCRIGYV